MRHKIRVLIVEDHAIVRQGIRLLLDGQPDMEVVGEAEEGGKALVLAERLQPDVILMDLAMPGINGLEATREVKRRWPSIQVIALTVHDSDEYLFQMITAGASGYVVKKSDVTELLLGIQAVHRGNTYFSSAISDGGAVSEYLLQAKSEEGRTGYDLLTGREREVLQLIAEGYSNQRIAQELFISVKTVEAHKAHIMSKLHAQTRADLIRYAIRKGLVGLDVTPSAAQESSQAGQKAI